jgi:hypothetical protein
MPRRQQARCSRLLTLQKNMAGPGYSLPKSPTGVSNPFDRQPPMSQAGHSLQQRDVRRPAAGQENLEFPSRGLNGAAN